MLFSGYDFKFDEPENVRYIVIFLECGVTEFGLVNIFLNFIFCLGGNVCQYCISLEHQALQRLQGNCFCNCLLFPVVASLALTYFLKTPVIYEGASAKQLNWLAGMLQVAFTETVAYSFWSMVSCVRLPACVYKTKMWYILKMHFFFLCVKKQQYQSQLKGKICWIWACVWSFRKLFRTPQHPRLLAGFLPGAVWEASHVLSVLTQAFLPQEGSFGQCGCFGQAKWWPPHRKSVLARFAKLIKAVSAVAVVVNAADLYINLVVSKPVWKHS